MRLQYVYIHKKHGQYMVIYNGTFVQLKVGIPDILEFLLLVNIIYPKRYTFYCFEYLASRGIMRIREENTRVGGGKNGDRVSHRGVSYCWIKRSTSTFDYDSVFP